MCGVHFILATMQWTHNESYSGSQPGFDMPSNITAIKYTPPRLEVLDGEPVSHS